MLICARQASGWAPLASSPPVAALGNWVTSLYDMFVTDRCFFMQLEQCHCEYSSQILELGWRDVRYQSGHQSQASTCVLAVAPHPESSTRAGAYH